VAVILTVLGYSISIFTRSYRDKYFAALVNQPMAVHRPRPIVSSRSADAPARLLDLTQFYNASLRENWHDGFAGTLASLPIGLQEFKGIRFDVRAIVQLSGTELISRGYPLKIEGLPVRQKCSRLHFLGATGWDEAMGRQVANLVVHYANGQKRFIPLLYGQDVLDWAHDASDEPQKAGAVVAWVGDGSDSNMDNPLRRLFLITKDNPLPSEEITTLDLESTMSRAAPFFIAITVDPIDGEAEASAQ
jgi:hypothetical protein